MLFALPTLGSYGAHTPVSVLFYVGQMLYSCVV